MDIGIECRNGPMNVTATKSVINLYNRRHSLYRGQSNFLLGFITCLGGPPAQFPIPSGHRLASIFSTSVVVGDKLFFSDRTRIERVRVYLSGFFDPIVRETIRRTFLQILPVTYIFALPVWRSGRAYDSGSGGPGFETRLCHQVFPLGKEISRHS